LANEGKALASEVQKVSERHLQEYRQSIEETLDEFGIERSRVFGGNVIGQRPAGSTDRPSGSRIKSITPITK
jgi:hypothetical protein